MKLLHIVCFSLYSPFPSISSFFCHSANNLNYSRVEVARGLFTALLQIFHPFYKGTFKLLIWTYKISREINIKPVYSVDYVLFCLVFFSVCFNAIRLTSQQSIERFIKFHKLFIRHYELINIFIYSKIICYLK